MASGGRYTRRGQSMDEVAFGRGGRGAAVGTSGEVQPRYDSFVLLHFLLSYELVLTSLDAVTVITDDYGTSKCIRDI